MLACIPPLLSQVDRKIYSNAKYSELIALSTWYCAFLAEVAKHFRRPNHELNAIITNQAERMKSKLNFVAIRNFASTLFYDMRDRPIDEFLSAFGLWNKYDYGGGVQLHALKWESLVLEENFGNCAVIGEVGTFSYVSIDAAELNRLYFILKMANFCSIISKQCLHLESRQVSLRV